MKLTRFIPLLSLALATSALAQTTWINLGAGDWNTAGNWDNGVPAGGFAGINNGGTAQLTGAPAGNAGLIMVGSGTGLSGNLRVTGAGVVLTHTSDLEIGGFSGTGTLSILNGGVVNTGGFGFVGLTGVGTGEALVSGLDSSWNITQNLNIGINDDAAGTVIASDSASVVVTGSVIMGNANGGGGSNATLTIDSNAIVTAVGVIAGQNNSAGEVTLTEGGTLEIAVGSGTLTLGDGPNSQATLFIGDDSGLENAGFLNADAVVFGNAAAGIVFRQINTTTFNEAISGDGQITQQGTGVTIMNRANTYTGQTSVTGGTLNISNGASLGSTDQGTSVATGATLELDNGITVSNEFLDLAGTGVGGLGALRSVGGINTWSGTVNLVADSLITADAGTQWILTGGIIAAGNNKSLTVGGAGNTTVTNVQIGTGGLTKDGAGNLTISGSNAYSGQTIVNTGTLIAGSNFTFSGSSHHTINATGTLDLAAFGGQEIASLSGTGNVNLNAAFLYLGNDNTNFTFDGIISGAGGYVVKKGSGVFTLNNNNTYTGTTWVRDGTVLMGLNNAVAVNSGAVVNNEDGLGAALLDLNGTAQQFDDLYLIAPANFAASTEVNIGAGGVLTMNGSITFNDNTTNPGNGFGASITGGELNLAAGTRDIRVDGNNLTTDLRITSVITNGGINFTGFESTTVPGEFGTLLLDGANTFAGGTTINGGILRTDNASALGAGSVTLIGGTLDVLNVLNTGSNLDWQGGQIGLDPDLGDVVNVATALTNNGGGEFFIFSPEYLVLATYTLATFGTTDFVAGDFNAVFDGNPNVVFDFEFLVTNPINGEVQLTILGATATGSILQNSAPVNIPTFADFFVSGPVTTGTPAESNTINSLTFADASSLQVFNDLTVTSGGFNVPAGIASINGGTVIVPGDFNLNGAGTLMAGSDFEIAGNAAVDGGTLIVNGVFQADGHLNVDGALVVNNLADIGGDLNAGASTVTVAGELFIGGSANLNNGSNLLVNSGGLAEVWGSTNINFGSSATINGELYSPQVNVNDGGLLRGIGLIVGDVLNNGTVAPGTSPGVLTIDGNYTQTSNGTLEIEPGDFLSISGNADLDGTLAYTGGGLKYGQQVAFLEADSISGEFATILVENPSKNRGRFLAEDGTGILLIAPTSYTLVAQTDNQRNVAKALDRFIPERGNDRETVSIALDIQGEGQYPSAFEQISPAFYESLADITIEQANAQNQNLAQRASALRLGARGFQSIGIEAPLVNDKDGKSVMDAKDGKDILSPAPDNKWGVWVQGNGIFARATNASQVPNYNFESGGFLAGADYRWSENFVTGLYAGYQGTYAKYSNGGRTTINSVQFGGYASYDNGGFYADGIVGGGYSAYAVKRPIQFSTIDRTASSRPDGGQLTTYLGLGYDWEVGNFTIGPILSGQYTYAGIAPFTENGADSLNLSVGQQNANSLRTSLGGRIAYTWKLTDSITLIPEGRMFWQHEFLENPRNIGATLDGGNGAGFGYTTSAPDRDAVFAGAGIIGQFGPNWNAYFYYNADFGRQDFVSHAISTGLNFKF